MRTIGRARSFIVLAAGIAVVASGCGHAANHAAHPAPPPPGAVSTTAPSMASPGTDLDASLRAVDGILASIDAELGAAAAAPGDETDPAA